MDERAILEQRIVTLSGLLDKPGGPLGASSGEIGQQLADRWLAERQLLERVLSEATGSQVSPTVDAWRKRTEVFVARSNDEAPGWTDRDGKRWNALLVLELLADIQDRLRKWKLAADGQAPEQ